MQVMIDRTELGLRLHLLRWVRDWSAKDVEAKTGISEATLLRWERAAGERYPDPGKLQLLATLYDLDYRELLDPDAYTRVWSKPAA